jgi:hypothetical protein
MMPADRMLKTRDFPWERQVDPARPPQAGARREVRPFPEQRRAPRSGAEDLQDSLLSCLPTLLREAAGAINTAEARVAKVEEEMARALEAAEERARSAEALAELMEQRATDAIREAEQRAQAAEARLAAAEEWIGRLRELMNQPV